MAERVKPAHLIELAAGVVTAEARGVGQLSAALDGDLGNALLEAMTLIRGAAGRVIVTGVGKSGHVASRLAATLASTGTPASFLHAGEAGHGDLGMISPGDVVLALSWSGMSAELNHVTGFARDHGVPVIAVTGNRESQLAAAASVVLVLPRAEEASPDGIVPTTSAAMQSALGDAIALALARSHEFGARDFAVFHPAGALGRRLNGDPS